MHEIRFDIIEKSLIVGDDDGGIVFGFQFIDTLGHNSQGIDIQAGVGLIEN